MSEKKTKVKMPSAKKRFRQSVDVQRMNQNRQDMWAFFGTALVLLLVFLMLTGVINQRKAYNFFESMGEAIGIKTAEPIKDKELDLTEDGLYLTDSSSEDTNDKSNADSAVDTSEETK